MRSGYHNIICYVQENIHGVILRLEFYPKSVILCLWWNYKVIVYLKNIRKILFENGSFKSEIEAKRSQLTNQ